MITGLAVSAAAKTMPQIFSGLSDRGKADFLIIIGLAAFGGAVYYYIRHAKSA